jgi:hypothetical protein
MIGRCVVGIRFALFVLDCSAQKTRVRVLIPCVDLCFCDNLTDAATSGIIWTQLGSSVID